MHPTNKEAFDLLVTRFLSGEASGGECDQLQAFLGEVHWRDRFNTLRQTWDAVSPTNPVITFDLKAASQRVEEAVAAANGHLGSRGGHHPPPT